MKRDEKNYRQLIVDGEYKSEGGVNVKLKQIGNIVKGRFGKIGRIYGTIDGNVLKGEWYGDPTDKCPEGKGKLIFNFYNNGDNFNGVWGYCDEDLINKWIGTKVQWVNYIDVFDASGVWNTTLGILNIKQIGDKLSIISEDNKLKMEGTVSGDTFKGEWSKYPTYQCDKDKGKIELKFVYEEDNFNGVWGYCNTDMNQRINGFKVSESKKITSSTPPDGGSVKTDGGSSKSDEVPLPKIPKSDTVTGEWKIIVGFWTNIKFTQDGNKLKGEYPPDNGNIEGVLENNVFKGYWKEGPTFSCPNNKGRMELTFSSDLNEFEGKWEYCENKPSSYIKGKRIK